MADKVVEIPNVGNVAFPDTMSDAEISAAAAKLYQGAVPASATKGMLPASTATADPTTPKKPYEPTFLDRAVMGAGRAADAFSTGVAKSFGQLALGAGEIVAPGLRMIPGVSEFVATPEQFAEARRELATQGGLERVGSFIGEAAQFAIPASKVAKAKTGVTVARELIKRGIRPNMARIGAGLTEAAAQGGTAAAVAQTRGDEHPLATGVLNAAVPAAGTVLEITGPAIREAAKTKLAKLLATGLEEKGQKNLVGHAIKTGETGIRSSVDKAVDIVRTAADELLDLPVASSWGKWQTMLASRTESAKQLLGAALKSKFGDQEVAVQPIIAELDGLIDDATQHFARTSGGSAFQHVVYNEPLLNELKALKTQLATYDTHISARNIVDIKRVWDHTVYTLATAGKVNADPSTLISSAMKEAAYTGANAIRRALDADAPTIAKLDEVVSHAIRLEDLVRKVAIAHPGIPDATKNILSAAGAGAGAIFSGGGYAGHILGASLGGAATRAMTVAMESPLWRTITPAMKARLANAIQAGRGGEVMWILGPLVSATVNGETSPASATAP